MSLPTWTDDPVTNPLCPYCDRLDVACICPDEETSCPTCYDEGWVSACIDDLCQGEQGCIHGDNVTCPDCGNPLGEVVP